MSIHLIQRFERTSEAAVQISPVVSKVKPLVGPSKLDGQKSSSPLSPFLFNMLIQQADVSFGILESSFFFILISSRGPEYSMQANDTFYLSWPLSFAVFLTMYFQVQLSSISFISLP
eukprot:TRINITY_DN7340_c0_g1_i4.p1 TRINITY_DN7340_c0_g1~~TRINITY_DN7340_c0_g1_i4.p1  ORF type:complete len:117 (+),score=17.92 TRINITY_DN7340_c0_g1_i4:494-844(+)